MPRRKRQYSSSSEDEDLEEAFRRKRSEKRTKTTTAVAAVAVAADAGDNNANDNGNGNNEDVDVSTDAVAEVAEQVVAIDDDENDPPASPTPATAATTSTSRRRGTATTPASRSTASSASSARPNDSMSTPTSASAAGVSRNASMAASTLNLPEADVLEDPDEDTVRVLLSTDNHLGYSERDPVRGLDSFAAMEEVLYLAKNHYDVDCVLLAGDLFHDNKPSRKTLFKTLQLFRKYCLGHDPIRIQVISNDSMHMSNLNGAPTPSANSQAPGGASSGPAETALTPLVNYEDEHYAVDLPIFSIHGNHDDPTREGGGELLAALDLLSVTNLVNYFGRQEQVQAVKIAPILLRKGSTKVALYGLGSMRDERLNRMWSSNHVKFLKPNDEDGNAASAAGDDASPSPWFNLFALHQNRDAGRGTKNFIHESMIPEWMDLVVWGHEHESQVEPRESAVGTFRVSQPGSSVATSLTLGEAVTKQIGILDIRNAQFRIKAVPLTQVRSFVMDDVCLAQHSRGLDPDDPKVDVQISTVLEEKTRVLIHDAREKRVETLELAHKAGNPLAAPILAHIAANQSASASASMMSDISMIQDDNDASSQPKPVASLPLLPISMQLQQPHRVLLRLRVDHTGFSAQSNQRFGAKFIQDIANPTDILLFQRKRATAAGSSGAYGIDTSSNKAPTKRRNANGVAVDEHGQPIPPEELDELEIEDLVADNLLKSDKKLELFDEKHIGESLQDYVQKQQAQAINEALAELLVKKQRKLIKREQQAAEEAEGASGDDDGDGGSEEGDDLEEDDDIDVEDEEEEEEPQPPKKRGRAATATASKGKARGGAKPKGRAAATDLEDDSDDGSDSDNAKTPANRRRKMTAARKHAAAKKTPAKRATSTRAKRNASRVNLDEEDDDSDIMEVTPAPPPKTATKSNARGGRGSRAASSPAASTRTSGSASTRSRRGAAASRSRVNYAEDDDDDEDEDGRGTTQGSAYDGAINVDDSDDDEDLVALVASKAKAKKTARGTTAARSRRTAPAKATTTRRRGRAASKKTYADSDDDFSD